MNRIISFVLVSFLAILPIACSRNENQPASANSENTAKEAAAPARIDEPAPREPARPNVTPPAAPRTDRSDGNPAHNVDRQPATAAGPDTRIPEARTAPRPARNMVTVPAGTAVTIVIGQAIGTDNNKEGDTFTATLADAITVDGRVVAERGTEVTGRISKIDEAGKVKGRARMELQLTELKADKNYSLNTEPFIAVAPDNKDRDAAVIAGGAGVGAAIGGIAGGKKGAAIGAIIGGGSGTTAVLMTKGQDIQIDAETKINFVLKNPVALPAVRGM